MEHLSIIVFTIVFSLIYGICALNSDICKEAKWNRNGITVAGGNGQGSSLNQLAYPGGIFVDENDDSIYIADTNNNRVVKYSLGSSIGEIVAGGNQPGNSSNQLNGLTKVVVDKDRTMFICDRNNRRIQRWSIGKSFGETILDKIDCWGLAVDRFGSLYISDMENHLVLKWPQHKIVAGGNGKGSALNQLSNPYHIFVDENQSIYVTDKGNNRIVKWSQGETEGTVIAGLNGYGNGPDQLYRPYSVAVDSTNTAYVVEYINLRVTRWFQGETSSEIIIGGNGYGLQPNQLYFPRDLTLDRQGNIFVADANNHRIQMFSIDKTSCQ